MWRKSQYNYQNKDLYDFKASITNHTKAKIYEDVKTC